MIKRPKTTDSEADIIRMQHEFNAEKEKNRDFQPAAKVVRIDSDQRKSKFAQNRNLPSKSDIERARSVAVLGEIVEKSTTNPISNNTVETAVSFPKPFRLNRSQITGDGSQSLFAAAMAGTSIQKPAKQSKVTTEQFGDQSYILTNPEAAQIHRDNVNRLKGIDEDEILSERQKLLETLDPDLIKFLQSKRKQILETTFDGSKIEPVHRPPIELPELEVLNAENSSSWMNFHTVEPEKFEWMTDVPIDRQPIGESYEARFDWKGVLLPYQIDGPADSQDLYLHGGEAGRPGYTLQELFRLARSNVQQQQLSAISAVSGILNIYNQGYYDSVLELPISKIFFLLRFAFDSNIWSQLEVTSKGLASLFYNESDEILLDFTYDCLSDCRQPILRIPIDDPVEGGFEKEFSDMNIKDKQRKVKFFTNVNEEEFDDSSMNDFQMAEEDLIKCFERTSILQRINYIFETVQPENSTITNCLKLLIRLARTDREMAEKILDHGDLILIIFRSFLPIFEQSIGNYQTIFYQNPQYLALKLFRIIGSYDRTLAIRLLNKCQLIDRLKNYIFIKNDINMIHIKLQIESFRLMKVLIKITRQIYLWTDLLPAFLYLIDWYYQFVVYEQSGPFAFRQHAAALFALVASGDDLLQYNMELGRKIVTSASKWFYAATSSGVHEFSQILLLTGTINLCSKLPGAILSEFEEKYLLKFFQSPGYTNNCSEIRQISPLLLPYQPRTGSHEPLPEIGSIVLRNNSPIFILKENYSLFLFNELAMYLNRRNENGNLISEFYNPEIFNYFDEIISKQFERTIKTNWFVRSEIQFLVNSMKFQRLSDLMEDRYLQFGQKIVCLLNDDELKDIHWIMDNCLFNFEVIKNRDSLNKDCLNGWKEVYLKILDLELRPEDPTLAVITYRHHTLPNNWSFIPLLCLLNEVSDRNYKSCSDISESLIISTVFSYTKMLFQNKIVSVQPTEHLMFLMIAFLGGDCSFLTSDIKPLLELSAIDLYRRYDQLKYNFDYKFEDGKLSFENLYIIFLNQFQATSYGDEIFGSLVMVPLAQKYDIKWRNMVWSEHVAVLRFINCTEEQLNGKLDDYLNPPETDEILLKCYYQALNSRLLRIGTVPYKIAVHHLAKYRNMEMDQS